MKVPRIFYANSLRNYQRKSVYKIYRKSENGWKVVDNVKKEEIFKRPTAYSQTQHEEIKAQNDEIATERPTCRENEMNIQMLSQPLYDQIFKNNQKNVPDTKTIER